MAENRVLFYLNELDDYKVASDYSDVRGWEIKDADNRKIGKVDNLLVNKNDERVVYLDVEVDDKVIKEGYDPNQDKASEGVHGFRNKEGEDHLIVPVGLVDIDEEHKNVYTDRIDYETFTKAKRFNKGSTIDREYEITLFRHYTGDENIEPRSDEEFYNRDEFRNPSRRRNR